MTGLGEAVRGALAASPTGGAVLALEGVAKRYPGRHETVTALDRVDLSVCQGEFLTIVGPSGCGKSTLLNLISGLVAPSEGTLRFNGTPLTSVNRKIGYITQSDNLLPWRTLRDNVAFPLELAGMPLADRHARADEWIERVGLGGFAQAFPHELSGGMRQRGNIIRTLIYEPEVILMDEPFGPLDAQTRIKLQDQLLSLWERSRSTVIFITHDLSEAIGLADRVVLMSARPGRLVRVEPVAIARPRDIFHIHDNAEFRRLYDDIWRELEVQVRG
jgi:NitT/TauT family transport system ATP-binding protein